LEDGAKHVILVSAESQADAVFYRFVNEAISHSDRRDAFIFIHGFNTTFQDAARRTGQIAYDLKFEGAAVFYTWPSQGNKSGYLVDQNNAEWTVPHLVTFLREFQAKSGARKVSIIAHSTGARILTSALEHLNSDRSTAVRFSQIILAAPDIDKDIFLQLAKAVNHTADRITLYAPSKDGNSGFRVAVRACGG
jgi:esterase/lipase superfamily enzyme